MCTWKSTEVFAFTVCVFACVFEGCGVSSGLFPCELIDEALGVKSGFMQKVEGKVTQAEN